MEFQRFIARNAPLSEVKRFTRQWQVTSSDNAPVVQPNLLAWFSNTNALQLTCANDNQDIIRFLLQMGLLIPTSTIVYATSKLRETNNTTVLELLLDFGWDINKPLGETRPPLISLVVDIPGLVLWCLSKGADTSSSSPSGLTIIKQAASNASFDTIKVLVKQAGSARGGAPVARASYSHVFGSKPDRVEVARYLLDQGYSADAFYKVQKASSGDTCEDMMIGSQNALHFAIWSEKEDMVRLLLERGANKTLPTRSLMKTERKTLSPSELARKFGHKNFVVWKRRRSAWGLPKEKLDSALLWKANNSCELYKSLIIPTEKGEWQEVILPSWCWISKGTEVWYDECYESVESMVEWHKPIHMKRSRLPDGSQGKEEEEEKKSRNLQSMTFLSDQISQENAAFDFALLHFTTESAILRMHTVRAYKPETYRCSMGCATLSLLSGKDVGSIWLPLANFSGKDEIQEEFILLSSTPIEAHNCKRESKGPIYNIMLVSWDNDNKFARRVAWTRVTKSVWQECERQRKRIILA
ncbi:hypothetical protein F4782DRAFT_548793 [Xylaria castorea]|nr:hypothetical protein F4782DRAFT_548793 [Xylaria castorea]